MNSVSSTSTVLGQKYVILGLIVILIFLMLGIRFILRRARHHIDSYLKSSSDFSIIIRKIPEDATEKDIRDMISSFVGFLEPSERQEADNFDIVDVLLSYKMDDYLKARDENLKLFKESIEKK